MPKFCKVAKTLHRGRKDPVSFVVETTACKIWTFVTVSRRLQGSPYKTCGRTTNPKLLSQRVLESRDPIVCARNVRRVVCCVQSASLHSAMTACEADSEYHVIIQWKRLLYAYFTPSSISF